MKLDYFKKTTLPIIVTILFSVIGHLFIFFLTNILDLEITKVQKGLILLFVTTASVLFFFPYVLKIPFGKQKAIEWITRLGFYIPHNFIKHILLGVLLGVISLLGMLIASLITGKYEFDLNNLSMGHFLFSLTPAIWEEILFRGVIMILLLILYNDIKKAFWWQVFIFAMCHFNSISVGGGVEIISVFIIGITFTLVAVKTRCLLAGVIYHYIHDSFLFLVQNPDGEYHGFEDNLIFYVFLWSAMLINIIVINVASDILSVKGKKRIYKINGFDNNFKFF